MPQVLKDEVEARIRGAALDIFSACGYPGTRMTEIARKAGVSAGNIYHYFGGKQALFAAVIPASLVKEFWELLDRRLDAAGEAEPGAAGAGTSPGASSDAPSDAYPVAARATVDFALEHRREMVFVLGRAQDTPYSGLAERVAARLVAAALDHADAVGSARPVTPAFRFDLEQIYHAYVRAWVRILEQFSDPDAFREALAAYERYHLAGLRALLD